MHEISTEVEKVLKELFSEQLDAELSRTEEQFGDYATNVAMRLSKKVGQNPREIAQKIAEKLQENEYFTKVEVAGPGFINLTLTDEALQKLITSEPKKSLTGKSVVAEYSDPNPFKVLHAGHLYTTLVGDAVSRLMENAGAKVHRVNFGGDVGLHVAKTMWRILKELQTTVDTLTEDHLQKVEDLLDKETILWIAARYVVGNQRYEEDETAKSEIVEINKLIYKIHTDHDRESVFAKVYWLCRDRSYKAFDELYEQLQVKKFDKYYPESEVADLGKEVVLSHVGKVYEKSDGAIVFRGDKYGLFTQVFINSEGLPTYAGKDVGLIYHKHEDYKQDLSFIFTDVAQKDHLAVVMKSIELFAPELVARTTHFTHGQIKLAGGVKMSSRKGNIVTAEQILNAASEANKRQNSKDNENVSLGAVKYAFLKQRIGGDIIYDPSESVSLQGNSGPYLQYAHARACSILAKSSSHSEQSEESRSFVNTQDDTSTGSVQATLEAGERSLLRKTSEYSEVVEKATDELMPHHICTYLYELAQVFNRFYEGNRVIGDERENARIKLVGQYATTLKSGLELLGIQAPEKM